MQINPTLPTPVPVTPIEAAVRPQSPEPVICPMPPRPEQPYRAFLSTTAKAQTQLARALDELHGRGPRPVPATDGSTLDHAYAGLNLLKQAVRQDAPASARELAQSAATLLHGTLHGFVAPSPQALEKNLARTLELTSQAHDAAVLYVAL